MRILTFLPPLFAALLLGACAGGPSRPDWVNGNSNQYPPAKYLSGKGEDQYQAVARDRARADLAKIFEVHIQEQSRDSTESRSQSKDGKTEQRLETSISRDIRTRTDQIIAGIEIAETWQDPVSKRFHALAILERAKAGRSLRENINRLDDVTGLAIRRARQTDSLLRKIGLAHKALQAQREREIYNRQLKIVDYSGRGLNSPYDLPRLARDRDALLQRMQIYVRVDDDPLGGLADMLKAAVAKAGFTQVNEEKGAYILNASLELNATKDAEGWYWQRGALEIRLVHGDSQRAQGSHRWSIKESSQDPEVAKKRVRDRITSILESELRPTLIGFGGDDDQAY